MLQLLAQINDRPLPITEPQRGSSCGPWNPLVNNLRPGERKLLMILHASCIPDGKGTNLCRNNLYSTPPPPVVQRHWHCSKIKVTLPPDRLCAQAEYSKASVFVGKRGGPFPAFRAANHRLLAPWNIFYGVNRLANFSRWPAA